MFRNNFSGENALDWVVIPFARGQLYDSNPIHAERIAAYFGGWANAAEMLRLDLTSLERSVRIPPGMLRSTSSRRATGSESAC